MDGIVRLSSRPAHSFFALLTLSLVSLIVFVFRRAPKHHVHYHPRALQLFERAVNDSHTSSILPSGSPRPFAALADPQTPSVTPSQVSSLPESSPSLPPKPIIISSSTTTTTTTTSIPSHTISTTTSPILSSTPTTSISTSSVVSTLPSSTTTSFSPIADVTPSTTFDVGVDGSPTSTAVESTADPSATSMSSSGSSSTQFWNNRGAVAATFTFISLIAVAFAIMIVVIILRSRKAKRDAIIDAEFMPNYHEPGLSPSPSISSRPLDPFKSREIVHDNVPTGMPASSYLPNPVVRELPTIHLSPPSAFTGPSSYFLSPSQPQATGAAGQRNKAEMRTSSQSGYQPSFDSFYGAYSP